MVKHNYKLDALKGTGKYLRIYNYNHIGNILRLFDGLANFSFTTSETKGDY